MKKAFLFIVLLATSQLTFAQSKFEKKQAAAKAEVEALERQRFAAQVEKNYDFLGRIFADDLIYTHSSGKMDSKETFINSIKEGKSVYKKVDVETMMVRPYNDQKTAVINGVVLINQAAADEKPNLLHLRYTVVYVKTKTFGWQLTTWQSLRLAQ